MKIKCEISFPNDDALSSLDLSFLLWNKERISGYIESVKFSKAEKNDDAQKPIDKSDLTVEQMQILSQLEMMGFVIIFFVISLFDKDLKFFF